MLLTKWICHIDGRKIYIKQKSLVIIQGWCWQEGAMELASLGPLGTIRRCWPMPLCVPGHLCTHLTGQRCFVSAQAFASLLKTLANLVHSHGKPWTQFDIICVDSVRGILTWTWRLLLLPMGDKPSCYEIKGLQELFSWFPESQGKELELRCLKLLLYLILTCSVKY